MSFSKSIFDDDDLTQTYLSYKRTNKNRQKTSLKDPFVSKSKRSFLPANYSPSNNGFNRSINNKIKEITKQLTRKPTSPRKGNSRHNLWGNTEKKRDVLETSLLGLESPSKANRSKSRKHTRLGDTRNEYNSPSKMFTAKYDLYGPTRSKISTTRKTSPSRYDIDSLFEKRGSRKEGSGSIPLVYEVKRLQSQMDSITIRDYERFPKSYKDELARLAQSILSYKRMARNEF